MAKTKPSPMPKNCLKQECRESQKPLPSLLSHDREVDKNKEEIQTVTRGKEAARSRATRSSRSASSRRHAQGGQRAPTLIRATSSSNKASIFENGGKKKTWNEENGVTSTRKRRVCCMAVPPPMILFIGILAVLGACCTVLLLLLVHHHEGCVVLVRRGISTMTGSGGTEKKIAGHTPAPLPRRVVERLRLVVVDSSITTTSSSSSTSTSSTTHHEEDDKMMDTNSSNKTIFENVGMNLVRSTTDAPTHLPAAAVAHDFPPPQQEESPTAADTVTTIASSSTTIPTTYDMMIGEQQQQQQEETSGIMFHTIDENSTLLRQEIGSGVHPPRHRQQQQEKEEEMTLCHFYLAKSKIPDSGLGIFTTRDISKGSIVGPPDIVIQVPDLNPYHADALRVLLFDYAWQGEETGGQYEGQRVYSFIPGFGMLANGHRHMYNAAQHYGSRIDNAGITRDKFPGAGSSSHYHEFEFRATSDVVAGSEILIDYGPNWFDEREIKGKIKTPENLSRLVHSVDWLRKNGICLDNLMVGKSSNPQAGRGAFSTRAIAKGEVVAPAPVVQIMHRKSLEMIRIKQDPRTGKEVSETLQSILLNYCFGHKNSSILLFPYAPIVNYINHSKKEPNVKLRWSQSPHHDVIDVNALKLSDLKLMKHAGLMLEFVATRDIQPREEILLDYGQAWQDAWDSHVERWRLSSSSHDHYHDNIAYIQDLDNDIVIRTKEEQQRSPYPDDIFTSCYYSYADGMRRGTKRSDGIFVWAHSRSIFYDKNLRPCIVLDRYHSDVGYQSLMEKDYLYTVVILNRFGLRTDERIPRGQAHIVTSVPRNAIRFSNKIYTSDQHLREAFRHEINLDELFPPNWLDLL